MLCDCVGPETWTNRTRNFKADHQYSNTLYLGTQPKFLSKKKSIRKSYELDLIKITQIHKIFS